MNKNKISTAACWFMGVAQGVLLVAVAGCAQQAVTAAVSIPPIPTGEARIWFYRDYEPYAGKGLPAIAANGGYVGAAELGGAFYRDVPPGYYLVTVQTVGIDTNQTANFDLAQAGRLKEKLSRLRVGARAVTRNKGKRRTS